MGKWYFCIIWDLLILEDPNLFDKRRPEFTKSLYTFKFSQDTSKAYILWLKNLSESSSFLGDYAKDCLEANPGY